MFGSSLQMWLQPVENFDIDLQPEENWRCSNTFCYHLTHFVIILLSICNRKKIDVVLTDFVIISVINRVIVIENR